MLTTRVLKIGWKRPEIYLVGNPSGNFLKGKWLNSCTSRIAGSFHSISKAMISFYSKDAKPPNITQLSAVGGWVWRLEFKPLWRHGVHPALHHHRAFLHQGHSRLP
eukprot:1143412-Pelagomonas_calceolata.AAC.1